MVNAYNEREKQITYHASFTDGAIILVSRNPAVCHITHKKHAPACIKV